MQQKLFFQRQRCQQLKKGPLYFLHTFTLRRRIEASLGSQTANVWNLAVRGIERSGCHLVSGKELALSTTKVTVTPPSPSPLLTLPPHCPHCHHHCHPWFLHHPQWGC